MNSSKVIEDLKDLQSAIGSAKYRKVIENAIRCIHDQQDAIAELEDDIADADRLEATEKALELYGDPSNWNGTHFAPMMRYQQTGDPWEAADKALK